MDGGSIHIEFFEDLDKVFICESPTIKLIIGYRNVSNFFLMESVMVGWDRDRVDDIVQGWGWGQGRLFRKLLTAEISIVNKSLSQFSWDRS